MVALTGALALSACGSGAHDSKPSESPSAEAASLRQAARDAYIFTYPLVMNYRTMYRQAIEGDGEFGKWRNLGLASPRDTDIVTPNYDTPYSYAWVDLRAEPWVLTMPAIEKDRYYTSQWDDLWGFVLDNPGSVLDGNGGISVLLAGPNWSGELPHGLARTVRAESDILGTLTRTEMLASEGGMDRVKAIQGEYKLQPLSSYLGTKAPPPAPKIDWPGWVEGAEKTLKYWEYADFMLQFVKRNPVDRPMYDMLATLGLRTDKPWDAAKLSPELRTALTDGVDDGIAELQRATDATKNSSHTFGTREELGTNYLDRAVGVFAGIFGDVAEQAMYFSLGADESGKPLNGHGARYSITFPPGDQPPVKYFWSITMYNLPDRFLVANPINRYAIGNRTEGLRENPDGSLTISVATADPGGEQSANWLPAPDDPFWMVLRTYGPDHKLTDGTWKPPAVVKVG